MPKKWLMVSNTWIPPALRAATTAAPTLREKSPPFAIATKPARSIRAFVSVETSAK
ncbi:MAG: hypothetical protein A4E41_01545 [Methanoregulaceae archaeon PtaU1.Bin066]|nr:MAG: hypothetical protein A4E41_01545 [Methanoregulaceae archaeon PtaU1.Bin066]